MPPQLLPRAAHLLAAAALGAVLSRGRAAEITGRPNIVLILADDLAVEPVATYGNHYYETPALDRMAREGMLFKAGYSACPVCSPTRSSLMTGFYPARTRVTDFIPGNDFPYAHLRQPDWQKFLPLEATTLAERLRPLGYTTAHFGKWHLAPAYRPPASVAYDPDRQGFDEVLITHKPERTADPERDAHNVEAITQRALRFLDEHAKDQRPFFLYLPHNNPHPPRMARAELVAKYKAKSGARTIDNDPVEAAMMETLDNSVGRVLDKLDALGLTGKTVVIFTSDNGGRDRTASATAPRGGKAELYEGGIRVPLLVRWPGHVPARSTSADPVITPDLYATILSLAGGAAADIAQADGVDLSPALLRREALPQRSLYWHYPHYHTEGIGPSGAIRDGNFKLIEYYETTLTGKGLPTELFDLSLDPREQHNLAASNPQKVRELQEKLARWRQSVSAQMPTVNPNYDAARATESTGGGGG